ncbi:hypothetical protein MMIC_P1190 [Mariprofundus micogutta]|uniref:Salt-induced outer membrane protein n=1 Tax=Mariprofundus micogutta TaxID=1921010 RepID=A0A1L8CMT9_9PROT|nr:DUF481 domain-containing protein [Mariprofundus micogutta]GAV20226.1 hypothetical protein MMIC_P1190 [Mariprofundus micogutta]
MKIFFFLVLFCIPVQAWAIINAEDLDLSMDEAGIAGKIGLSLTGSSGNSDKTNGEASGRLMWRHARHTEMLVGSYTYGTSRGIRDTNKAFAHLRHRYALNNVWDIEAFAQAQQNEFASLKLRTLLGGGMRWTHRDNDLTLHVGMGAFHEREKLRNSIAPATRLWRGNAYMALGYSVNERVRLQNTLYFQPALNDSADYRLLDDAALSVTLTEQLDLRLSIEYANDSKPPVGIKDTDINYKTGLELRF